MMSNTPIHIIAEARSNHNDSIEKAQKLIRIAANSKADSVKFQLINTWGLYLPGKYPYGGYDIEDVLKFRKECEFTDEEFKSLFEYAKELDITLSASIFDLDGLHLLSSLNPPYIKIASTDLNNLRLLRATIETGQKVVLSTGMSTLKEIEVAVKEFEKRGNSNFVLLHCVSVYPATLEISNVRFVETLKKTFGCEVGFSDHTPGAEAACMALTLGATWFEKHFTEDKSQKGLDHKYALVESELSAYVETLHFAKAALAPKETKITAEERHTMERARRSLYSNKDLPVGYVLTDDDILCVRPSNVFSAADFDFLVGKQLVKSISQYEPFTSEHLQ